MDEWEKLLVHPTTTPPPATAFLASSRVSASSLFVRSFVATVGLTIRVPTLLARLSLGTCGFGFGNGLPVCSPPLSHTVCMYDESVHIWSTKGMGKTPSWPSSIPRPPADLRVPKEKKGRMWRQIAALGRDQLHAPAPTGIHTYLACQACHLFMSCLFPSPSSMMSTCLLLETPRGIAGTRVGRYELDLRPGVSSPMFNIGSHVSQLAE